MVPVFTSPPETFTLKETTFATDIWMLGVSFWRLHNHDHAREFAISQSEPDDQPSHSFVPRWSGTEPQELRKLIERCCSQKHERPSIHEIVDVLHDLWQQSLTEEQQTFEISGSIPLFLYLLNVVRKTFRVACCRCIVCDDCEGLNSST
jgi:hypothetical protein